jgi:type II secretory pathway pseudopilin PulG
MKNRRNNKKGFSLTEILLAVGTLAVGMIFVAGVFPVAIHFTTIATERTISAVVADEAFSKVRLFGLDFGAPNWPADPTAACVDFRYVAGMVVVDDDFAYPSTADVMQKKYYWSALCRRVRVGSPDVQVTVFVCRKAGPDFSPPVPVSVSPGPSNRELQIGGDKRLINDGYTIVDDQTGRIYRVLERYPSNDTVILLDRDWEGPGAPSWVWAVPPPASGGRYPCIAVYQKVIEF